MIGIDHNKAQTQKILSKFIKVSTIYEEIEGGILNHRYMIQQKLDEGFNGEIYKCCDLEDLKRPLVIKISKNHKELKNEIVSI